MAKDTFYTAVDIGTDKVTSVVARVGSEGELKVMGTGVVPSEGVQRGASTTSERYKPPSGHLWTRPSVISGRRL